jgi:fibronectin-binding autotransporter adhesin
MKRLLRPSLVARTVPTGHLHETLTLARIKSGLQRLGLSLVLLIAAVSGARAQFTDWNAASGDWSNPANWTSGVPNASLSAIIGFGSSGIATISSSDKNEAALGLFIGQSNTAALTINSAGTGTIGEFVTVTSGGILAPGNSSLPETNQPGVVDRLVSKSGFTDQFWDGPLTTPNGVSGGNGGSGTWNNTTTNWTNFNGTVNAAWQSGFAIFAGSGGIVTLGDDINFTGIQFAINGYFITAGGTAFTLVATQTSANGGTIINVDPASLAIIDAPITGPGQIVKDGTGTLILTGVNNYSGGTAINNGTLQLGNGGSTGSIVGRVVDNATLAIDHSNSITLAGDISGNGGLEQIGTGNTILSGNNTYLGVTLVTRGVLTAGSNTAFSPYSQLSVSAGAFVRLGSFSETIGSLTGAGTVAPMAEY